jgi:lactose-specific phosphotransferase system enzyme II factor III
MYNLEEISFKIITFSGDAQSKMLQGLKTAKEGEYEKARSLMEEGKNLLHQAHRVQTDLIVDETQGNKTPYSILMVHAQDHLMNAMLAQNLISEMIDMYEVMKKEKK